jgi:hypothetical protein
MFSGILQRKLKNYAEEILGEYQCGFRPRRGATDQIFVMRQSMDKCFKYNTNMHMMFIDFRQAFGSIKRRELLNALEGFGVPQKLIKLIGLIMKESPATAFIGGKTS